MELKKKVEQGDSMTTKELEELWDSLQKNEQRGVSVEIKGVVE
jgi:hypothetical protein